MLLNRQASVLVIVDVQEKLFSAMVEGEAMLGRAELLLRVANRLAVPILATEHCPDSLGHTVPRLARHIPPASTLAKRHFDATREPGVIQRIRGLGRSTLVLMGSEAHVCVLQSALGLVGAGYSVAVVADAVATRKAADRDRALRRLEANGVECVSAEMAAFEWLETAATPEFREVLDWIK